MTESKTKIRLELNAKINKLEDQLLEAKKLFDLVIAVSNANFTRNMCYPQYSSKFEGVTITTDDWIEMQDYTAELITRLNCSATIKNHWKKILSGIVPFNMRVVKPLGLRLTNLRVESREVSNDN